MVPDLPSGQEIVTRDQGALLEGGSTYVIQPRTALVLTAD